MKRIEQTAALDESTVLVENNQRTKSRQHTHLLKVDDEYPEAGPREFLLGTTCHDQMGEGGS